MTPTKPPSRSRWTVIAFFLLSLVVFTLGLAVLSGGCVDIDEALPHYIKELPR